MMKSIKINFIKSIISNSRTNFATTASNLENNLTALHIKDNNIAILTLNSPPVNAMGIDLLSELKNNLKILENKKPKGLILTSALSSVFSAGLDLKEIQRGDEERLINLWTLLQDVSMGLYCTEYPTAAVICGHAIAGGCALGVALEHRVMLSNYTIGLNEVQVGLHMPKWLISQVKQVLPKRLAEAALTQGRLFTTKDALKFGLIDEIASNSQDAFNKCENFIQNFHNISLFAHNLTKKKLRHKHYEEFETIRKKDLETFLYLIKQEIFQKNLHKYLDNLKKHK